MNTAAIAAILGVVALQAPAPAPQAPAAPAAKAAPAPRAPRVSSPEVAPDRRVTFRLAAPKASEVQVSGEFMSGSKPMARGPDGVWSLTVGPLEPEVYNYNFTIDGVKTIDPGNAELKTGSTASTTASVLSVPGAAPLFHDGQSVPHGEVHTLVYDSKSLGKQRRVTVYTPPGYERGTTRYPVLYLLHGANADETAWIKLGRADVIMDNLLAAKKARPFIVVMPFGYGVPPGTSGGQNTAAFARDLLGDVIPLVQARFRARTDRDHRALVGLSMGGGQALAIGLDHRELFSHVGGFSSGLGKAADFPQTYASVVADPRATNKQMRLIWIGCGREDGALANSRALSAFLTEHEVKNTLVESGGAHTWMVWRRYLNELAPLLFQTPARPVTALR
jgi:enterochelin esterase-like enzyme